MIPRKYRYAWRAFWWSFQVSAYWTLRAAVTFVRLRRKVFPWTR